MLDVRKNRSILKNERIITNNDAKACYTWMRMGPNFNFASCLSCLVFILSRLFVSPRFKHSTTDLKFLSDSQMRCKVSRAAREATLPCGSFGKVNRQQVTTSDYFSNFLSHLMIFHEHVTTFVMTGEVLWTYLVTLGDDLLMTLTTIVKTCSWL